MLMEMGGPGSGSELAGAVRPKIIHTGRETHPERKLTDEQERQVLDHWLANHNELTVPDLVKWVTLAIGVKVDPRSLSRRILPRAAAAAGVRLPPPGFGKGRALRRTVVRPHRNEPGSGKLPTQGSQYFNPGATINPPKPPAADQTKR
tara:strand:- start:1509 stop:1952 length:444 start_codon:yes stop_codon:yes gene_type:complete